MQSTAVKRHELECLLCKYTERTVVQALAPAPPDTAWIISEIRALGEVARNLGIEVPVKAFSLLRSIVVSLQFGNVYELSSVPTNTSRETRVISAATMQMQTQIFSCKANTCLHESIN